MRSNPFVGVEETASKNCKRLHFGCRNATPWIRRTAARDKRDRPELSAV